MNKNLLSLAGLLSLLAVNQASCWGVPIKNETSREQYLHVIWKSSFPDRVIIPAGQTKYITSMWPNDSIGSIKSSEELFYKPKIENRESVKGLTIKIVNGKDVIVEN